MSSTSMLMLMTLMSLVTYSTSLSCWHSGSDTATDAVYTSMRATQVPVLMKECTSAKNTTCLKEWYTVGRISDVFYKLECSNMVVAAEKATTMGTGEKKTYTCNTDYCNTSTMVYPVMWMLGLAIIIITNH
eukprot:TRINITY_DN47141_c0_g1_i1.p1 TRINITY_DN47141_c0_g1~~TRINITY_DN47141_c0_g1_i1.p1  ORF type:complete len:131 (-),score=33.49 TRINITY_DN47141_c0_g1_i1:134-526(-)